MVSNNISNIFIPQHQWIHRLQIIHIRFIMLRRKQKF